MNSDRFEAQIPDRLGNVADTIRIKLRYA
jgi:hypothetical protein